MGKRYIQRNAYKLIPVLVISVAICVIAIQTSFRSVWTTSVGAKLTITWWTASVHINHAQIMMTVPNTISTGIVITMAGVSVKVTTPRILKMAINVNTIQTPNQ